MQAYRAVDLPVFGTWTFMVPAGRPVVELWTFGQHYRQHSATAS